MRASSGGTLRRVGALRRVLDGLALTLFAAFLVVAVPLGVTRAAGMLNLAWYARGEPAETGRIRMEGEPYVRGIDAIRAALPPDEPYLLVEGGRLTDGDTYWVRFDLAPRRAILLGRLADLGGAGPAISRIGSRLRHVVVAYAHGAPPRLYDRHEFVEQLDRLAAGAARAVGEPGAGRLPGAIPAPQAAGDPGVTGGPGAAVVPGADGGPAPPAAALARSGDARPR